MVEARQAEQPRRVVKLGLDGAVALQQRQQVGGGLFPPVDLARLQGAGGGGGIRRHAPFDAVEIHPLRPGGPLVRAIGARHVIRVALIDQQAARHAFIGFEAIRAAAHDLLEGDVRVLAGDPLRHDEADRAGRLGQRVDQQREGLLHPEGQAAVVIGDQFLAGGVDRLAHGVARPPALDGGNGILGQHRRAIVELEPGAERDSDAPAAIFHRVPFGHLRLRLELRVQAVERVVNQEGMVARDIGGGDDGVDHRDVRLRDELQHPVLPLGEGGGGQPGGGGGHGQFHQIASLHRRAPWLRGSSSPRPRLWPRQGRSNGAQATNYPVLPA